MNKRILIAAGGTGGHIFPAVALGEAFSKHFPEVSYNYLCGERQLERRIYAENGIDPFIFPARQMGTGLVDKLLGGLAAAGNTGRAMRLIAAHGFEVVIGMGGYVTGPAVLGGILLRRKTAVHEANSIPGKTNRLLAPYVNLTALHFESAASYLRARKHLTVGMPVRRDITKGSRQEAIRLFELDAEKKTLLILGGSQGAKYLYENLMQTIPLLDLEENSDVQLLWSTGLGNFEELGTRLRSLDLQHLSVKLVPFITKMEHALAVADVALARAGASSCAELLANGVFTLYIPFPSAIYDHQTFNAQEMEKAGAGNVMAEKDLSPESAEENITALLKYARSGTGTLQKTDCDPAKELAKLLVEL